MYLYASLIIFFLIIILIIINTSYAQDENLDIVYSLSYISSNIGKTLIFNDTFKNGIDHWNACCQESNGHIEILKGNKAQSHRC